VNHEPSNGSESGFQRTIRDEPRTYAKRPDLDRTQEVSGSNPLSSMPQETYWLCGNRGGLARG
jgi:hypothetical protein